MRCPRDYTHDRLFPAVREQVRKEFGIEVFTHALFGRGGGGGGNWPPTQWSHDAAAWTVEAKFIVNDYGLRNRLAIITETPGQPTFERRVYAQYAYLTVLLEYANGHARQMMDIVKAADEKTVTDVQTLAESGQLRNWLDGEYQSRGKIEVLGYPTNVAEYRAGTSFLTTRPGTASGPPEKVMVDDLTKPVGTRDAIVPRGYLFRTELADIAAKLRAHNVRVTTLDKPMKVQGEAFAIKQLRTVRSGGYEMRALDGTFSPLETREFPAGSFYVDMAQPMANAAFYYLEPQARDGFVGWRVMDGPLGVGSAKGTPAEYPIFKMRKVATDPATGSR